MLVFCSLRHSLPTALLFTLLAACTLCRAQEPTPVGGKWMRTDEMDNPSSSKVVVFTLPADEADLGRSPAFRIACNGDGRAVYARYFADTTLRVTLGDYRHFDDPAMTPKIRVDKKKTFAPIWDLFPGNKYADIDKQTVRALLTSSDLRVHFVDKETNNFTDMFSPAGLNLTLLKRACGDNGWFPK